MKGLFILFGLLSSLNLYSKSSVTLAAGDWPPFLKKKGLAHLGVGAHIVKKALKSQGIQVKFKFYPWSRGMTEAKKAKKVDGAILWLKNPDREKIFYYSDKVMAETNVFFHLKGSSFKCSSDNNLLAYKCMEEIAKKNLRVGGIYKFSYSNHFDKAVGKSGDKDDSSKAIIKNFKRKRNSIINFEMLIKGKIDLYPQEINVGYYELNNLIKNKSDATKVTHLNIPLQEKPSYLIMSKKNKINEKIIKKFNEGLKALRESGEYEKMLALDKSGGYACKEFKKENSGTIPGC
tara:strand:- start:706 stop:1575 length:870 start_codon:yes stop_codon:yes gene_type:complete